ncbi:hypothetical protein NSK_001091 [Nannochloropsis salina CCMP1776]|uniref:Prefoldin subunit 2 n=1 Tax=Nannochloropsis salina CCMP1776 TaxID=1027361 RepID=A0A4D9D7P7_9STRA|nr:hypothetical protein NSK_001091 [Nannochloropsis salina CCMP1776]|eukprot:TFJ87741.1 hypothetical protein NSK_001091 [Nannochloropsis salina CCMP1776]
MNFNGIAEATDPSSIIQTFQNLQGECQQMTTKLQELEMELSEHELVIQQLTPLEPSRKAYRLLGGVLMERTVGEVLPVLSEFASKLRTYIPQLDVALAKKQKQTREWRDKYNIRAQSAKEIEALQQKTAAAAPGGATDLSAGGVLA